MASWENTCNTVHGLKPTLIMIFVQFLFATVNIFYKLALNDGMPLSILVAYRLLFAAAFIFPFAIYIEREKRPKLTGRIVFYGFLCGLFGGSLGQNLFLKSLALTSATFASAIANLVPAITFIIAACLRIEKVGLRTNAGKAKVLGTLIGIGGAMVFTFYKGLELNTGNTGINLLNTTSAHPQTHSQQQGGQNLVLGLFLALASCVSYSLWLIIQSKAAETYPCPYSLTAMLNFWGSIQGTVYAMGTERDWSHWVLGWNIRLLAVLVAGILGSGMFTLMAWCIRMRGPLFVSVFNPLNLVMVAIAGALFLEEKLFLGMVFGGILIIVGLYIVLWGKGKEIQKTLQVLPESTQASNRQDGPKELCSSSVRSGGSSRKGKGDEEEEGEQGQQDSFARNEVLAGFYIRP